MAKTSVRCYHCGYEWDTSSSGKKEGGGRKFKRITCANQKCRRSLKFDSAKVKKNEA